MTRVTLFREGERIYGCRAEGHSGWGEEGEDIVCAAVSVLTTTCVNALESVCGVKPRIAEYSEEKGILAFTLPEITAAEDEKAQILMKALKQGLEDVAGEFPKNVKLSINEGRR